jgi:hypothetical protein
VEEDDVETEILSVTANTFDECGRENGKGESSASVQHLGHYNDYR